MIARTSMIVRHSATKGSQLERFRTPRLSDSRIRFFSKDHFEAIFEATPVERHILIFTPLKPD